MQPTTQGRVLCLVVLICLFAPLQEASAQDSRQYEFMFVQMVCGQAWSPAQDNFVLPCSHPAFAGARDEGMELGSEHPHWYNVCGLQGESPVVPAVVNWNGECIQLSFPPPLRSMLAFNGFERNGVNLRTSLVRFLRYDNHTPYAIWNPSRRGLEVDEAFMSRQLTLLGNYSRSFYLLFTGATLPLVGLFVFVLVPLMYFLRQVGESVDSESQASWWWLALSFGGVFLISIVPFWVFAVRGRGIAEAEENFRSLVAFANTPLDSRRLESNFLPIDDLIMAFQYPPLEFFNLEVQLFFGLAGLLLVVAHVAVFRMVLPLALDRGTILTGIYHVFVPSKHAQAFRRSPTEPIGTHKFRQSFRVPSPEEILKGTVSIALAPFRVASSLNQARKNRKLAEVLDAQADEIDSEVDLMDSAERRERSRVRHTTRTNDDE